MEKLKGNQNVRNTVTGRYTDETERNDPERVVETDKQPEQGTWESVGYSMLDEIRDLAEAGKWGLFYQSLVNLQSHCRALERP